MKINGGIKKTTRNIFSFSLLLSHSPLPLLKKMPADFRIKTDLLYYDDAGVPTANGRGRDVNKTNKLGRTCFYNACQRGDVDHVVQYYRLHGDHLDVNSRDHLGLTPFLIACESGKAEVVDLLLHDPRVDTTAMDKYDCGAFWLAAWCNQKNVLELLIASGRDFGDVKNQRSKVPMVWAGPQSITACEAAKNSQTISLIQEYVDYPIRAYLKMRAQLNLPTASFTFAIVVLICDEYLQVKAQKQPKGGGEDEPQQMTTQAIQTELAHLRFLGIITRLPMELQMLLCNIIQERNSSLIKHQEREEALKLVCSLFFVS